MESDRKFDSDERDGLVQSTSFSTQVCSNFFHKVKADLQILIFDATITIRFNQKVFNLDSNLNPIPVQITSQWQMTLITVWDSLCVLYSSNIQPDQQEEFVLRHLYQLAGWIQKLGANLNMLNCPAAVNVSFVSANQRIVEIQFGASAVGDYLERQIVNSVRQQQIHLLLPRDPNGNLI